MHLPEKPPPWVWLLLSAVIVVVEFNGATLYVWHRASAIDTSAESIAGDAVPSVRALDDARTELHNMNALVLSSLLDTPNRRPFPHDEFEQSRGRLHRDVDAFLQLRFFQRERGLWGEVNARLADAELQLDGVVAKVDAGDFAGAKAQQEASLRAAVQRADRALGGHIAFDADQSARLSGEIAAERRTAERTSFALHGVGVLLTVLLVGVSVDASRRYVAALRLARDVEANMTKALEGVATAAVSIADSVRAGDAREVLQTAVDRSRAIAQADFAALGIGTDPSRAFDPFLVSGVDRSLLERYGPPRPIGVLGAVIERGGTLRAPDIVRDPRFGGLPEGHPCIGPFLGTVVRHEGDNIGHLYLGRAPGAALFTEQDARAVELLATVAAAAVQNAMLNAELRREVQRRQDILSVVSHDLRNPLSAITMAAQSIARAGDAGTPTRHAERIVRTAGRMDRLIDDLLTAARLEEGSALPIEPEEQDAAVLLRDAVDALATAAAEKGIELRGEVEGGLPAACCDARRIGQVLSNLIANSLKFTPKGGLVAVKAAPEGTDQVRFSVRDTGEGIPEDALPHLFERFWQKEGHRMRGTGLGLYIAKGIIDAHHGRIWVTSRSGQGSEFQFTVPAVPQPHDPRRQVARTPPPQPS